MYIAFRTAGRFGLPDLMGLASLPEDPLWNTPGALQGRSGRSSSTYQGRHPEQANDCSSNRLPMAMNGLGYLGLSISD